MALTQVPVSMVDFSVNPTLSGGTANGVAYLNGSKVVTTGSALVFDGSRIGLSTATSNIQLTTTVNTNQAYISLADADGRTAVFRGPNSGSPNCTQIGSVTNHDVAFLYGNSEQMRLTSTGLGVGTTSPTAYTNFKTLEIGAGGGTKGGLLRISGASNTVIGYFYADSLAPLLTLGSDTATPLSFVTGGTERARIDASGNLGLGVTPSAWASSYKALQIKGISIWTPGSLSTYLSTNLYSDGTNRIYINNGYATEYTQVLGQHQWFTAASGTAGNAISFTQAMTLAASGNLLVGTTTESGSGRLRVAGEGVRIADSSTESNALLISSSSTASTIETRYSTPIILGTGAVERARIDSSGNFQVGTAALATTATNGFLYIPTCAGTPTGTPTAKTGLAPIIIDSTNNKMYIYSGGAWVALN